jgi:hypothetical protein
MGKLAVHSRLFAFIQDRISLSFDASYNLLEESLMIRFVLVMWVSLQTSMVFAEEKDNEAKKEKTESREIPFWEGFFRTGYQVPAMVIGIIGIYLVVKLTGDRFRDSNKDLMKLFQDSQTNLVNLFQDSQDKQYKLLEIAAQSFAKSIELLRKDLKELTRQSKETRKENKSE